jgi:hypothetical protein
MQAPGQQEMARLAADEGDGPGSAHSRAADGASVAIDARRDVDREHRAAGGVDGLDGLGRLAGEIAREARPEQRIDDEVRPFRPRLGQRNDGARPVGGGARRVALEVFAVPEERDPHLKPGRRQQPRRHKSVAAVVARAGDDEHPPSAAQHPAHHGGHRLARPRHQRIAGRSPADGERIGLPHLARGEKFGSHGKPAAPRGCPGCSRITADRLIREQSLPAT